MLLTRSQLKQRFTAEIRNANAVPSFRSFAILGLAIAVVAGNASPAAGAAIVVPHTDGNQIVAENTHATDHAFSVVHRLSDQLHKDYVGLRKKAEIDVMEKVLAFKIGTDDVADLLHDVGGIGDVWLKQWEDLVRFLHWNMDELVVIAEELLDTNLLYGRDESGGRDALQALLKLRKTTNEKMDALMAELKDDCGAAMALTMRRAQVVCGGDAPAGLGPPEATLKNVFLGLLDGWRTAVHLNMARSILNLSRLEHLFRDESLRLTVVEKMARDARS